jgi:hypothetical protein
MMNINSVSANIEYRHANIYSFNKFMKIKEKYPMDGHAWTYIMLKNIIYKTLLFTPEILQIS